MSYIILDLDNTISDDGWRIPRISWDESGAFERYNEYHLLAGFDAVGNEELFRDTEHDIIVFTARPVFYSAITFEWLERNGINPFITCMRNNNDHCQSVVLKRRQLSVLPHYGIDVADIACAYDDRPDVVAMYKAEGIRAKTVNIHNVCAYTSPEGINHG